MTLGSLAAGEHHQQFVIVTARDAHYTDVDIRIGPVELMSQFFVLGHPRNVAACRQGQTNTVIFGGSIGASALQPKPQQQSGQEE